MTERLKSVTQVWVDDAGKTRTVKVEYGEDGNAITQDTQLVSDLPDGFPGRDAFIRAGLATIEAVRAQGRSGPFTRIEGIDFATGEVAERWLVENPEDTREVGPVTVMVVDPIEVDPDELAAVFESRKPIQGQLPPDFPGFEALAKAQIHTYNQARKAGDLTEIDGIGEATAAKIKPLLEETLSA